MNRVKINLKEILSGLPLVGGDESYGREISEKDELFAPRKRG